MIGGIGNWGASGSSPLWAEKVAARFQRLDANGDGSLTQEEFAARAAKGRGFGRPSAPPPVPPSAPPPGGTTAPAVTDESQKKSAWNALFDSMDSDGDGGVTPTEFQAFIQKMAEKKTQAAGPYAPVEQDPAGTPGVLLDVLA